MEQTQNKMNLATKILAGIAGLFLLVLLVGLCRPKEREIMRGIQIDQMYFMVLGTITNHWEEPMWRHNLDTMIQVDNVDGQDCWIEYYTNGDSIKLFTQTMGEFDYVRLMITPSGRELLRSITIADVDGKTAIRMTVEAYETDPIKRFFLLFTDPEADRVEQYLSDLKAQVLKQKEEMGSDDGFFGF